MDFEFCMQDPGDPGTRYLYEAIINAASEANAWQGIYAFASRNGVNHLINDPVVQELIHRGGEIDLIVGIDAVTNRQTLERLQELEARHHRFRPKVFWNNVGGLFHPKISQFSYADGRKTLIVGSGNLTPGGLMHNFEAYSIISAGAGETLDLSSLEAFLIRNEAEIAVIDEEALQRAARNVITSIGGEARRRAPKGPLIHQPQTRHPAKVFDRIQIAQVPGAGGRWSQVHFNANVIENYFRITDLRTQRVYLTQVHTDGTLGEEEVRPCVYSETNKNYKIEIAAAKGLGYPTTGRPMLVFRERKVRCFDYMLLMPGQAGHAAIFALSESLPSVGKGLRRAITDMATLGHSWPSCPLLSTATEVENEL